MDETTKPQKKRVRTKISDLRKEIELLRGEKILLQRQKTELDDIIWRNNLEVSSLRDMRFYFSDLLVEVSKVGLPTSPYVHRELGLRIRQKIEKLQGEVAELKKNRDATVARGSILAVLSAKVQKDKQKQVLDLVVRLQNKIGRLTGKVEIGSLNSQMLNKLVQISQERLQSLAKQIIDNQPLDEALMEGLTDEEVNEIVRNARDL